MRPKVGNSYWCGSPKDLLEIYSIIENLEEDYDDNELIEALADVMMERQEKVSKRTYFQLNNTQRVYF